MPTIGIPKVGRRPDILDNGKQRLDPRTNRPIFIPTLCVTMENKGAADVNVCVTIYKYERRGNKKKVPKEICTQKKTLPRKRVGPFGSMTTLVEVCCDLQFPPGQGEEYIAAWEIAGAGKCGKVRIRRANRSPKLTVAGLLRKCLNPGESYAYASVVGVGIEDMEVEKPAIEVASSLPMGWSLELPEEAPTVFPAMIKYTVNASPAAYPDEVATIKFSVVDEDGQMLDDTAIQFAAAEDTTRPFCANDYPEHFGEETVEQKTEIATSPNNCEKV